MYIVINHTLNSIPFKHENVHWLCETTVNCYPNDSVAIVPIEVCDKAFNAIPHQQLQQLYNKLGYRDLLDKQTLTIRLAQYCWYCQPTNPNKCAAVNKKYENISLRVL